MNPLKAGYWLMQALKFELRNAWMDINEVPAARWSIVGFCVEKAELALGGVL